MERATIPYLFTTQGSGNGQQLPFNRQQNANTDQQAQITDALRRGLAERDRLFPKHVRRAAPDGLTVEDLQKITDEMNSEISNLDDFFRPIKSYFYWERHCFDIPICWTFRSVFETLDDIDKLADDINDAKTSLEADGQDLAANHHSAETHG